MSEGAKKECQSLPDSSFQPKVPQSTSNIAHRLERKNLLVSFRCRVAISRSGFSVETSPASHLLSMSLAVTLLTVYGTKEMFICDFFLYIFLMQSFPCSPRHSRFCNSIEWNCAGAPLRERARFESGLVAVAPRRCLRCRACCLMLRVS